MPDPDAKTAIFFAFLLSLFACKEQGGIAAPECEPVSAERARAEAAFDRYRRPDLLIAALGLRGGEHVADIGAGSGYLSFRLADAVGANGKVVATDVDAKALAALRKRAACQKPKGARIDTHIVAADEPGLADAHYDLIVMSEVDHFLKDRAAYLRRLRPYLAGGGRLVVSNRRSSREALLSAARDAGFFVLGEEVGLPAHFLLFFGVNP